jgi:NadR type nicotinamide-nucleotide adenylyltransferase
MPTRGLTLGRYAPLHRGHQLVIEAALREMDEVVVVIYDRPGRTPVPLHVRAEWIRRLYPRVMVIEVSDGPAGVGNAPEIGRQQEEFILNGLGISGITHLYSSERDGDRVSAALGAVNRLVDPDRSVVPISSSAIRGDPWRYRRYIDPVVYRDLITNVVLLGAPATGKTTLAERLATEYHTAWMPEYGREYWERNQVDRRLSPHQLVELAEIHLEREERMLNDADGFLFTDTNAITTWMFSLYYHGMALQRLSDLADEAVTRYDIFLLCDIDIPYDDSWDLSGEVSRRELQNQIVLDLVARGVPFHRLQGDLESRVAQVREIVGGFVKWETMGERKSQERKRLDADEHG